VSFAERVRGGELVAGTFVSSASSAIADAAASGGVDWIVVDLEHGVPDFGAAIAIVRGLSARLPIVVRTPPGNAHAGEAALDAGAAGILLPRIDGRDEATALLERTAYSGSRGLARAVPAWGWGADMGDPLARDAHVVRIVQIETAAALEAAEELAALPAVDALFLGAIDLALDLRRRGKEFDLETTAAHVASAALSAGKAAGALVGSPEELGPWSNRGYTLLACSADVRIVADASARIAAEARRLRA